MKGSRLLLITGIFAVLGPLSGCGGTTGGLTNINTNPYMGRYQGTWTGTPASNTGTAQITIAQNGVTTGILHNNATNLDGSFAGQSSNEGSFRGTLTYPGQPAAAVTGSWVQGANSHLTGNFQQTQNGNATPGTLDLAPM
jgi:hypothetical protein